MLYRLVGVLVLCWAAWCLPALAEDSSQSPPFSINWNVSPAPPFTILQGEFQGQGMCDVLVNKIIEALPDLHHEVTVLPHTRIKHNAVEKQDLCFPCMIKRQQNPYFVYSKQTVAHPAQGIITRPGLKTDLLHNADGPVSLAELVANTQLRFGRPSARRYPDALQAIIDQYDSEPRFFTIWGGSATVRIMQQIELGRLDYTLEYPNILNYYRRINPSTPLVFLPVSEAGSDSVPGAIGCTNNAWGKQAVEHVNRALETVLKDPEYLRLQSFWQHPATQEVHVSKTQTEGASSSAPAHSE